MGPALLAKTFGIGFIDRLDLCCAGPCPALSLLFTIHFDLELTQISKSGVAVLQKP
jgi:hypothetical protein